MAAGTRRIAGCPSRNHGVACGRNTRAALWPYSTCRSEPEAVLRLPTAPLAPVTLLPAHARAGGVTQRGRRRIDYATPAIPAAEGSAWGALEDRTLRQSPCESP
jgi:hypothetical protein